MFSKGPRLWGARFVEFYKGLRLLEAQLYLFYVSGRLSGGRPSNEAKAAGGTAQRKDRHGRWGEGVGGSICRGLRGSGALGGLS